MPHRGTVRVKGVRFFLSGKTAALFFALALSPLSLAALSSGGEYQVDSYSVGAGGGAWLRGGAYATRGLSGQPALPEQGGKQGGGYNDRPGFYDPPYFTFQRGQAAGISLPGNSATLTLPAGSVDKEAYDIILNNDVLNSPLLTALGQVSLANSRLETNEGGWAVPKAENIAETYIYDEQDVYNKPLSMGGLLSMSYKDDNGDGIIDGTDPPVRILTSAIWTLDPARNMWVKMGALDVDPLSHTITVPFMAPGAFAIVGLADDSVSSAYAFPVPFRPNGPAAGVGAGLTGSAAGGITFTNLPQRGSVEIYTLDGLLVRKLDIPANLVTPQVVWDVKNSAGEKVRSDTYIWRVASPTKAKTGKLMVIW